MPRKKRVTAHLPILKGRRLGGLHYEVCSVKTAIGEVTVSSGWGMKNTEIYVSVEGKRVLTVDSRPLLTALINEAIGGDDASTR